MKQSIKRKLLKEFSEFLIEEFIPVLNLENWRIIFKFQKGKDDKTYASIDLDSINKEATLYLNPYLSDKNLNAMLQQVAVSVLHELIHCVVCDVDLAIRIVMNVYRHQGSDYISPFISTLYERSVESITKVLINCTEVRDIIFKGMNMIKEKYAEEIK